MSITGICSCMITEACNLQCMTNALKFCLKHLWNSFFFLNISRSATNIVNRWDYNLNEVFVLRELRAIKRYSSCAFSPRLLHRVVGAKLCFLQSPTWAPLIMEATLRVFSGWSLCHEVLPHIWPLAFSFAHGLRFSCHTKAKKPLKSFTWATSQNSVTSQNGWLKTWHSGALLSVVMHVFKTL